MSLAQSSTLSKRHAEFLVLASALRPNLHRYCARLMGSVIEGEDVVQDTIVRALESLPEMDEATPLRPWLFRIAHNRALDLLRSRAVRRAEPMDAAAGIADMSNPDPMEAILHQDAVKTAVSRFSELPIHQRSAVILKDVLDESLAEIAELLDMTVDAVKGHLARGRARLQQINAQAPSHGRAPHASELTLQYIALFNQRDWDGLRAMLAADVMLNQSSHPVRAGALDVGFFFTKYAGFEGLLLVPGWLEGREVVVVLDDRAAFKPCHFMWLEWRNGQISFIHDYCHVRYVALDAEISLQTQANLSITGIGWD